MTKNWLNQLAPRAPGRITLGFGLAFGLILVGFGLTVYAYNQFRTDRRQVEHTYKVETTLTQVFSLAKDIETGVRGYLIAGDRLYLEPYDQARPRLQNSLDTLQQLLAGNPAQRYRIDSLRKLLDAKLQIARQQIDAQPRHQRIELIALLAVGKIRMDAIRRWVAIMQDAEQQLLKSRIQKADDSYRLTLLMVALLLSLTLLSLLLAYWLLTQELSQRQQNEDQLRAYETELQDTIRRLKNSNEDLERFAFVASHDLQEPLRKIQAFSGLLEQRHSTLLGDDASVFLGKIMASAERMSRMIKDLLEFSRLSSRPPVFQMVPLATVINRVLSDLDGQITQKQATVTVGALPSIEAVPGQLDHLFMNLIANALKFTRPGVPAEVHINARPANIQDYPELLPANAYVEITVQDNGIGFDEKYLAHIFDVFQRLHSKSEYDGTGIGLAVCRKVVQFHQGLITARSQPGHGATFVVVLPAHQTQHSHDRSHAGQAHTHSVG